MYLTWEGITKEFEHTKVECEKSILFERKKKGFAGGSNMADILKIYYVWKMLN